MEKTISKLSYFFRTLFVEEKPNDVDWSQIFVIRYDSQLLFSVFAEVENDLYTKKKPVLKILLLRCIDTICTSGGIQVFNAANVLCDIVKHTAPRISKRTDPFYFILGTDLSEYVKKFGDRCASLIKENNKLCNIIMHTLISVISAARVPSLLETLSPTDLYDSLFDMLMTPQVPAADSRASLLLLTLLMNPEKYDPENLFITKLSMEEDESAILGYNAVICLWLMGSIREYESCITAATVFGSLVSKVSNLLGPIEGKSNIKFGSGKEQIENLLSLLCAVRCNRTFIASFLPVAEASGGEIVNGRPVGASLLPLFITYCSFVLRDIKGEYERNRGILCFLILALIMENPVAASAVHDPGLSACIPLYRTPMLHRDAVFIVHPPPCMIATAVWELLYEFIVTHMSLTFPFELYELAIGIVHRMVAYEKQNYARMAKWRPIFEGLLSLLNFLSANVTSLGDSVHALCLKIVVVLNLFITYGDTFLPNAVAYDEMCYEIIRLEEVFVRVLRMAIRMRDANNGEEGKIKTAEKLINQLENPLEIVNHFTSILKPLQAPGAPPLFRNEVLEVVRANFATLRLRLYERLEITDPFDEKVFKTAVRCLLSQVKENSLTNYSLHNFNFADVVRSLSLIYN